MVVLFGKISGSVHCKGIYGELNGYSGQPDGQSNGSDGAQLSEEKYQEVAHSIQTARRELDRISGWLSEHSETPVGFTPSRSVEAYKTASPKLDLPTRNGSSPPEKRFEHRQSILTDMFAIPHLSTVYNIAVAIFLMLLLDDFVVGYVIKGERPKLVTTFGMLWTSFTGLHRGLGIWLVMLLSTACPYAGFAWWAQQRSRLISTTRLAFDYLSIAVLAAYIGLFIYLPVWRMGMYDLGLSSVVAVLLEQIRLLMKLAAFVRSNVPRALEATKEPLDQTEDDDDEEEDLSKLWRKAYPSFNKFLYFLFAPTFVYRDFYPRSKKVRWRFVATSLLEFAACVIVDGYLVERFILPPTRVYGADVPANFTSIATILVSSLLPCFLVVLVAHYALFHAWLNAFAEMLRFGDRVFYLDWWNQKDYLGWFRTWNVVVQDWLYTYIYRDVAVITGNKMLAKASVFVVSAVFHEYVLAVTFKFFMPLQLTLFMIIGGAMALFNLRSSSNNFLENVWLLLSLTFGNTMMIIFYSIEYYARVNCRKLKDDSMDFFLLRSFNCETETS